MPPKKQNARKDAPPPIPSRDHFERAHFAVQASVYLQQLGESTKAGAASASANAGASGSGSDGVDGKEEGKFDEPTTSARRDRKGKRRADAAAEPYSRLARAIGNVKGWTVHNQVKIDPSLKRALCKGCSTVLIPGLTSRVRIRPCKPINKIHHTCLNCKATLTLHAAPTDVPEAGVDGPVRAKRRAKVRRAVVFHERERRDAPAEGEEAPEPVAAPVHVGKRPVGAGHVLWRGNEKVHGWGVAMPPIAAGEDDEKTQQPKQKQNQQNNKNQQQQKQKQANQQPSKEPRQQNEQRKKSEPEQRPPPAISEEEAANNMDVDEEAAFNM